MHLLLLCSSPSAGRVDKHQDQKPGAEYDVSTQRDVTLLEKALYTQHTQRPVVGRGRGGGREAQDPSAFGPRKYDGGAKGGSGRIAEERVQSLRFEDSPPRRCGRCCRCHCIKRGAKRNSPKRLRLFDPVQQVLYLRVRVAMHHFISTYNNIIHKDVQYMILEDPVR